MHDFDGARQESASQTVVFAHTVNPPDADLWRILRDRRSIRRYTSEPVAAAVIETLLEAARWAPSAHNRQPWRFCVVRTPDCREQLAHALAERWRSDLALDGVDEAAIAARVDVRSDRMRQAPVLFVAALCMDEMDVYPDARRQDAERIMGVQSVALACQNLLLAAHAQGLGACWMCAPLFAPEAVRDALALPGTWEPQALITLGYAAEARKKERESIASRTLWR